MNVCTLDSTQCMTLDACIEKEVASYWLSLIFQITRTKLVTGWRELVAKKEADEIYPLLMEEISHSESSTEISEQVIEACI